MSRENVTFTLRGIGEPLTGVTYEDACKWAQGATNPPMIGLILVNACADAGRAFSLPCQYPGIRYPVRMQLEREGASHDR